MTNPGNIVRVRARKGGRASVYEANAWCQAYTAGLLDGKGVLQNTVPNMTVLVGGSPDYPDVVLATNPAGYRIALDLVGQQPITITAPASGSRISSIIAYTDDLALVSSDSGTTGSPSSCGLIVVNGTTSATPTAPNDTTIRNAITADGAAGAQASYGIIANIKVASNTTTIGDSLITKNVAIVTARASNLDVDKIHPVGSLYFSTTSTNPSEYFEGTTWEAYATGRTLIGVDPSDTDFDAAGKTGGSKTQELVALIGATDGDIGNLGYLTTPPVVDHMKATYTVHGTSSQAGTFNHGTKVLQPLGNEPTTLQPYVAVYIWRRTK